MICRTAVAQELGTGSGIGGTVAPVAEVGHERASPARHRPRTPWCTQLEQQVIGEGARVTTVRHLRGVTSMQHPRILRANQDSVINARGRRP